MIIEIRVRSNSTKNVVGGLVGEPARLMVAVQSPAVEGKANREVLKILAKALEVRQRDLTIVFGERARDKRIEVAHYDDALIARFEELCRGPESL